MALWQPRFWSALHCFGWFSFIQAQNLAPFIFLDCLFSKESFAKVSYFFVNRMNRLGTGSTGGLVVAPFYKCFALFWPVLPHPGSELSAVSFFGFLFFGESFDKISEFLSTICTSWEPVQPVLHDQPCFINTLHCFGRFSLIRARNWAPFIFLNSLLFGESVVKISELFSTGWTGWEPIQQPLHDQPRFSMFWPLFLLWLEPLSSKALVGLL